MSGPGGPRLSTVRVRWAPGLLLAGAVAALCLVVAPSVPLVGPSVLALLAGVVLATARPAGPSLAPGLRLASARVLQLAIVLLGLGVQLQQLRDVGLRAVPVVLLSVLTALVAAELLGRVLGVGRDLRSLIGAGTAICGASAVAAAASALRARPADVSYALSTVVLFNLAAVLSFPALGRLLGMDEDSFGVWAGAAVNDTSAVVATATAWGGAALGTAVVVKLLRVLLLVPLTAVLARRAGPAGEGVDGGRRPWQVVPGFLVLFVLAAALSAAGLVPGPVREVSAEASQVLVTVALAAVGLSTRLRDVARAGASPLLLGGLVWLLAAAVALGAVLLLD